MKQLVLFLVGISLALGGCQSEDSEKALLEKPRTNVSELTGVERDIAANILASRFGGYRHGADITRAMDEFTLTPYVVDGDTLLYVAQYDEGWEIYSASHATNMVLFSSDEGQLDMDDPPLPEQLRFLIAENAADIAEIPDDTDYIDPSWGGIALTAEELSQGAVTALKEDGGRMKIQQGDLPPGHWVLIEVEETGSETHTTPKLIKTKWGQDTPWNAYAKWLPMSDGTWKLSLAGCIPVAVSQYMYFTHYKNGVPGRCASNAMQGSEHYSDYKFFGESTNVWNNMAKYSNESGTNESALLIGSTGRKLKSEYGLSSTSTADSDLLRVLSETYETNFEIKPINYVLCRNYIKEKGYPIIASARTNRMANGTSISETGHTFLIDQYRETIKTYRYLYGWERDPLPPGTIDKWIADRKDADGNIIVYAYTNEVTSSSVHSTKISMNWGADGWYDNVFYSPTGEWNAVNYIFNLIHYAYVRNDL